MYVHWLITVGKIQKIWYNIRDAIYSVVFCCKQMEIIRFRLNYPYDIDINIIRMWLHWLFLKILSHARSYLPSSSWTHIYSPPAFICQFLQLIIDSKRRTNFLLTTKFILWLYRESERPELIGSVLPCFPSQCIQIQWLFNLIN